MKKTENAAGWNILRTQMVVALGSCILSRLWEGLHASLQRMSREGTRTNICEEGMVKTKNQPTHGAVSKENG